MVCGTPVIRSLIQLTARSSVQPVRDEWVPPRDKRPAVAASGGSWWTSGDGRPSVRAVYGRGHMSANGRFRRQCSSRARATWRLGSPHNLWEPMFWNVTSGVVVVALLPIVRHGTCCSRVGAANILRDEEGPV